MLHVTHVRSLDKCLVHIFRCFSFSFFFFFSLLFKFQTTLHQYHQRTLKHQKQRRRLKLAPKFAPRSANDFNEVFLRTHQLKVKINKPTHHRSTLLPSFSTTATSSAYGAHSSARTPTPIPITASRTAAPTP